MKGKTFTVFDGKRATAGPDSRSEKPASIDIGRVRDMVSGLLPGVDTERMFEDLFGPTSVNPLTSNELDTLRRASKLKHHGQADFLVNDLLRLEDEQKGKAGLVPNLYRTLDSLIERKLIVKSGAGLDAVSQRPAAAYKITTAGEVAFIFGVLSLAVMAPDQPRNAA